MIAFVDSSVVLRKLFSEPHPLKEWPQIKEAYASRMLIIEIGRVIDRCRLSGKISDEEVAELHQEAKRILRSIEVINFSDPILTRAAQAMPTVVGTLDAIHLSTLLELSKISMVVATHDQQFARAARAFGFVVIGDVA